MGSFSPEGLRIPRRGIEEGLREHRNFSPKICSLSIIKKKFPSEKSCASCRLDVPDRAGCFGHFLEWGTEAARQARLRLPPQRLALAAPLIADLPLARPRLLQGFDRQK